MQFFGFMFYKSMHIYIKLNNIILNCYLEHTKWVNWKIHRLDLDLDKYLYQFGTWKKERKKKKGFFMQLMFEASERKTCNRIKHLDITWVKPQVLLNLKTQHQTFKCPNTQARVTFISYHDTLLKNNDTYPLWVYPMEMDVKGCVHTLCLTYSVSLEHLTLSGVHKGDPRFACTRQLTAAFTSHDVSRCPRNLKEVIRSASRFKRVAH